MTMLYQTLHYNEVCYKGTAMECSGSVGRALDWRSNSEGC